MERLRKKPGPIYVKRKDGSIYRLPTTVGREIDKRPITFADETAAALNPDLVITEEELEERLARLGRENYKLYEPIIEALRKYGPNTLEEISKITGKPVDEDGKCLGRLYEAALIKKKGDIYSVTKENLEGILQTFDVTVTDTTITQH